MNTHTLKELFDWYYDRAPKSQRVQKRQLYCHHTYLLHFYPAGQIEYSVHRIREATGREAIVRYDVASGNHFLSKLSSL